MITLEDRFMIKHLHKEGVPKTRIARELGVNRRTVDRAINGDEKDGNKRESQSRFAGEILEYPIAVSVDSAPCGKPYIPAFRLKHSTDHVVGQFLCHGEILERLPIISAKTAVCPKPQIPMNITCDAINGVISRSIPRFESLERTPIIAGKTSPLTIKGVAKPEVSIPVLGNGANPV